ARRVCVTFCLYCYGHRPRLPSFPTRRSSDLDVVQVLPCGARLRPEVHLDLRDGVDLPAGRAPVPDPVVDVLLVEEQPAGDGDLPDRKSTRLNSSHSQISYAVFCLKKKSYTHQ